MKFGKIIAVFISALIMLICSAECPVAAEAVEKAVGTAIPERYLEGNELELYREILENIKAISEGKQSAEAFYISVSTPFKTTGDYEKALNKAMFFIRNYAPEYYFWADSSGSIVYDTTRCGVVYGISPAYQKHGDKNMISSDGLYEAGRAAQNAQSIVNLYWDKNDYEKVIGYAEEICALNTYNKAAASSDDKSDYSQKNINPWRMVYVFDRDPSTNVVCGGYAMAFQYLCSLGGVECHYVTGSIKEGYHAWNIVVIDGVNYLVDLTACDAFPEEVVESYHPLVMNGVASSSKEGANIYFNGGGYLSTNVYKYADDEMMYLPEELRTVSTRAYSEGGAGVVIAIVVIAAAGAAVFYFIKRKNRYY